MRGHDRARDRLLGLDVTDDPFDRPGRLDGDRAVGAVDCGNDPAAGAQLMRLTRDRSLRPRDDSESFEGDLRAGDFEEGHHVAAQPFDPEAAVGVGHDPAREHWLAVEADTLGLRELVGPIAGVGLASRGSVSGTQT